MQRFGSVIELRSDQIERYKQLHEHVWDGVLAKIRECNIRNYSIFLRQLPDGKYYLFSYFEYTGKDFAADMTQMAADPATQEWWAVCKPLQQPLPGLGKDEWWAAMEEVFHAD